MRISRTLLDQFKLLALPLARPTGATQSTPLFYLHAKRLPPTTAASSQKPASTDANGDQQKPPVMTRVTDWAANQWNKLADGPAGGWKRKTFAAGQRLMDRIAYEEWALKAIDPAMAPRPWQSQSKQQQQQVDLLYPPSLLEPKALVDKLKEQLANREPHHRSYMLRFLLLSPLTWPFALVPVIPNFPLFYMLWRAWSHWRAWKASQYLNELIDSKHVNVSPSNTLDDVYKAAKSTLAGPSALLLNRDMVVKIVQSFKLTKEEQHELERAVDQSQMRIELAQKKQ